VPASPALVEVQPFRYYDIRSSWVCFRNMWENGSCFKGLDRPKEFVV